MSGLAQALAEALEPESGWYADFTAEDERVVVLAGKATRRQSHIGSVGIGAAGRTEAIAYGRSAGTPERQLDWKE
ncbi:hypothetical protein ACWDBW_44790 [Streptomyces sp. NPDC001107]